MLDGVTFRAEPGEFIALVGPSGAGKSTLLRLLLGFEQPETGTVEYDGKDLSHLDVRAVRQQAGVVVQQARLLPGSIFHNIIGSSTALTVDDAWEAARIAGLDEDIRAMPMGMQTMISEGNATFSGGQRQRILIARAVAAKPRILLFDEATSALDNRTQASVTASLERLRATRIVIAHRLSTIRGADRILVLDDGRLVQSGTYVELAGEPGTVCRPRAQAAGVAWHASGPHPTSRNRLGPGRAAPRSRHSRRTRSSSSARLRAKGSRPGSTRRRPPVGATTSRRRPIRSPTGRPCWPELSPGRGTSPGSPLASDGWRTLPTVAIAEGVRQIVVLGAGFDTLGLTLLHADAELLVVELDRPAMVEAKELALAAAKIALPWPRSVASTWATRARSPMRSPPPAGARPSRRCSSPSSRSSTSSQERHSRC